MPRNLCDILVPPPLHLLSCSSSLYSAVQIEIENEDRGVIIINTTVSSREAIPLEGGGISE